MSSDHPFYQFMLNYPKQMFALLGLSDIYQDDYIFTAPVIKETEFRADGFYRGKALALPMVFVELNLYSPENIYLKTITEAWLTYTQTPDRPESFYVFILFDKKANDPGCNDFVKSCMPPTHFHVIYLEEILNHLSDNPYFTLLNLMVGKKNLDADLEKVKRVYQNLPPNEIQYLDLCLVLLSSKYPAITLNHLYAMFPTFKDELKQSVAIQELTRELAQDLAQDLAKGIAQDLAKGIAQDLAKGIAQDMAKGMAQNIVQETVKEKVNEKAKDFASKLIEDGTFSVEKIANLTGLSIAEVEALLKKN